MGSESPRHHEAEVLVPLEWVVIRRAAMVLKFRPETEPPARSRGGVRLMPD